MEISLYIMERYSSCHPTASTRLISKGVIHKSPTNPQKPKLNHVSRAPCKIDGRYENAKARDDDQ